MTTSRTKHVDIRTKYVHEYKEDGVMKIIFVKPEDNTSDIMTKISRAIFLTSILPNSLCENPRNIFLVRSVNV